MGLKYLFVFILSTSISQFVRGDIFIDGGGLTTWGEWGEVERCPCGTFAHKIQLKIEPFQGEEYADDSALNGIRFGCGKKTGCKVVDKNSSIHSLVGEKGEWGKIYSCENGTYITGVQLRSEKDLGGMATIDDLVHVNDDTAANNLRFFCGWSSNYTELDGMEWGEWQKEAHCEKGYAICGIKTMVENLKKETDAEGLKGGDNTGLNNLKIECCKIQKDEIEKEKEVESFIVPDREKTIAKIIDALKTLV